MLSSQDVAAVVTAAAGELGADHAAGTKINEARMRDRLAEALRATGLWIDTERHVSIPAFRGVGAVDIVARPRSNDLASGLIECKWSVDTSRDKIYEGAWDAVKLALATRANPSASAFLVTAAPSQSWNGSETPDLFHDSTIHTRELWDRPLSPKGPNGGTTVGADCEAGGYGNMFTHAPEVLTVRAVVHAQVPGTDMVIKASAITAASEAMIEFAPAPEFPERMTQRWLENNVPSMPDDVFERLLTWLAHKRWTQHELDLRVHPLRTTSPAPQARTETGNGALMRHRTFKYVFGSAQRPAQWGLRGDSELWDYLYATLYHVPIPKDPAVAEQTVRDLIENRTGMGRADMSAESWEIDLFATPRMTGMSSGFLAPTWWRDTGLPHIRAAIEEALRET
jgi:hypothetical protein